MNTQQIFDTQNRLASKIKEMRSRIEVHRGYIGGHETRTRQLLIDPLLRELGWDLEDPSQVHVEFKTQSGRPDYALWSNDVVVAVIEAKTLGKNLDNDPYQVIKYGTDTTIPDLRIFVKTDGDRWMIFPLKPVTEGQLNLSISKQDPFVAAQIIMRLLKTTLVERIESTKRHSRTLDGNQEHRLAGDQTKGDAISDGLDDRWVTLKQLEFHRGARRPNLMRLPDGKQVYISSWKKLWIEIAEWVTSKHSIDRELSFGHLDNMAIRDENVGFWDGFGQQLQTGYWVAGGTINTRNSVTYARALVERVGEKLDSVLFSFD